MLMVFLRLLKTQSMTVYGLGGFYFIVGHKRLGCLREMELDSIALLFSKV